MMAQICVDEASMERQDRRSVNLRKLYLLSNYRKYEQKGQAVKNKQNNIKMLYGSVKNKQNNIKMLYGYLLGRE
jgi:hypothetical protein